MKALNSALETLPALVCAAALMLLLGCSGGSTLSIETGPNESCKFVDTKTGESVKYDKLVFHGAPIWKVLCENTPLPMGDPSRGRVVMLNSPDSMKVEGNTTTYNDATFLASGYKAKYTLKDGTLTILDDD